MSADTPLDFPEVACRRASRRPCPKMYAELACRRADALVEDHVPTITLSWHAGVLARLNVYPKLACVRAGVLAAVHALTSTLRWHVSV